MLDNAVPIGDRYYWESNFVSKLTPDLADVLSNSVNAMPSPRSMILLFEVKGEIRRGRKDAWRSITAMRILNCPSPLIGPIWAAMPLILRWAREVWSGAQLFVSSSVYANHLTADETPNRVQAAYGADKYEKLMRLNLKRLASASPEGECVALSALVSY